MFSTLRYLLEVVCGKIMHLPTTVADFAEDARHWI
jgi:hypothetical protein